MSTCNQLDLESLGSWPTLYAQKLPGHCFGVVTSAEEEFNDLLSHKPDTEKVGSLITRADLLHAIA